MTCLTDRLLEFGANIHFEDLPAAVVHEARRYVMDALGCALGGHAVDKGRIAALHARRLAGPSEAMVIGDGGPIGATAAAFANAELVNALDQDSLPHVVPITLPPVLAAAQATHASGAESIAALVVAHEIGIRLNRASSAMIKSLTETGSTPEAFGINNESIIGAALGACRLLGHTRPQRSHALGLAAYFCTLPVARDWEEAMPKSMAKYTPVGLLAQNALQAALLAREGFTGNPRVLDAPRGFACFNATGRWEPELVTRELGHQWAFLDQQYKPWPCCRFFHSQLDLLQRLIEDNGLGPDEIEAIHTHGPRFVANPTPHDTRTQIDVQFSLPFCMALVAHGVPADARWQIHDTLARVELHTFARRVTMHADPHSLEVRRTEPRSWWARVEVVLVDGRKLKAETLFANGTNGTPGAMDDAALEAKFRRHAERSLAGDRIERAVEAIWGLDRIPDAGRLLELLAPL
ncbi:MAG: MmgE/PrpD family protein [Actinobacteria bacterium]|nr:MmgE/PrpD family protein [Actinomycetota bacterium]